MRTKEEVATIINGISEILFTKMVEAYSTGMYAADYEPNHRAKIDLACYLKRSGLTYAEWEDWCKDTEILMTFNKIF